MLSRLSFVDKLKDDGEGLGHDGIVIHEADSKSGVIFAEVEGQEPLMKFKPSIDR
jgi:hypothetical protein